MSLLNILGLYTSKQYNELKDISNSNAKQCEKLNQELQQARTEITSSHQEITKLRTKTEELEKQNDTLVKRNAELSSKLNENTSDNLEELNKEIYMYNNFEGLFSVLDGVKYINDFKLIDSGKVSFIQVFNHIWKHDNNKRVTFKEFNEEFTKLYNNRNSELINGTLKKHIELLKDYTTPIPVEHEYNYTYNHNGVLCYKTGMRPVRNM